MRYSDGISTISNRSYDFTFDRWLDTAIMLASILTKFTIHLKLTNAALFLEFLSLTKPVIHRNLNYCLIYIITS